MIKPKTLIVNLIILFAHEGDHHIEQKLTIKINMLNLTFVTLKMTLKIKIEGDIHPYVF